VVKIEELTPKFLARTSAGVWVIHWVESMSMFSIQIFRWQISGGLSSYVVDHKGCSKCIKVAYYLVSQRFDGDEMKQDIYRHQMREDIRFHQPDLSNNVNIRITFGKAPNFLTLNSMCTAFSSVSKN
jgi:hypothetical protein